MPLVYNYVFYLVRLGFVFKLNQIYILIKIVKKHFEPNLENSIIKFITNLKKILRVSLMLNNSNPHFFSLPAQVSFFSKKPKLFIETTHLKHKNKTKYSIIIQKHVIIFNF